MEIDLRDVSFEEWLNFVFGHDPVPEEAEGDSRKEWYWALDDDEIAVDDCRQVMYLHRLFQRPSVLLQKYTRAQIDQGFWCMFGGWGHRLFEGQLWNPDIPWDQRAAAIRAIETLYEGLFGVEEVGSSVFMLWDLLAYDYYCGNRHPERDPEDARVQQVMFETLECMLRADSQKTQLAALHGLHHLMHSDSLAAVRRFLEQRCPSSEVVAYAERVLARRAE